LNKRGRSLSAIAIICIIVTVALFFILTSERNISQWVGLVTMLTAELILFGGIIYLELVAERSSQIILRIVCGLSLLIFSGISIIVSIICIVTRPEHLKAFTGIQILLLAIMIILIILGKHAASHVNKSSTEILAAESKLRSIKDALEQMAINKKYSEYKPLLDKVAEAVRFSDTSAIVPADDEIVSCLADLEDALLKDMDNKAIVITEILDNMLLLVNKRKIEIRNKKSGSV
jgi:hypothetical protein